MGGGGVRSARTGCVNLMVSGLIAKLISLILVFVREFIAYGEWGRWQKKARRQGTAFRRKDWPHLIALLSLRGVLRHVLKASLVVHDELVLHEVEAVRLCLVGVRDHLLDFWRCRQVEDGARAARFITNKSSVHNARGTPGRF